MPASSAAHSRKSERRLQQKNLFFCSFAHILFTFRIFAVFITTLRLKHQQYLLTIIHYDLASKEHLLTSPYLNTDFLFTIMIWSYFLLVCFSINQCYFSRIRQKKFT